MPNLNDEDREILTAYLDGELDDDQSHALEGRLGREPELRAELEAMRQAWGLLDYLPRAQPSPTFTERTMSRLSIEKVVSLTASAPRSMPVAAARRWPATIALASAVALALLGG